MTSQRADFRPDIEALRGLAVLLVVIFHFDERWLPGGYSGVDVFFVISGFVVTKSLMRAQPTSAWGYLVEFYSRRVRRIMPPLLACVATTSVFIALVIPPEEAREMNHAAFTAVFGMSNLYFGFFAGNYFGLELALNPLTHTWSLGVEEQFYLFFPLILLAMAVGTSSLKAAPIALAGITLSSLILLGLLSREEPFWAFYLMPTRLWELSSGALIFVLFRAGMRVPSKALGIASVPLFAIACLAAPTSSWGQIPGAVFGVAGASAFIAAGHGHRSVVNEFVTNHFLLHFGRISYSLYLWHWPVLVFFRWTVGTEGLLLKAWAALIMYGLARASYHMIERPMRRWKPATSRVVIWGTLASAVAAGAVPMALSGPLHGELFLDKPALEQLPRAWWPHPCHLNHFDEMGFDRCMDTDGVETRRLYLIGDSHAGNFWPMLERAESELRYHVHGLTMGAGCGFLPSEMLPSGFSASDGCVAYNESIHTKLVGMLRPGDVVVVAIDRAKFSGTVARFAGLSAPERRALMAKAREQAQGYRAYLEPFAAALHERQALLILIGDVPAMTRNPKACPPVWWRSQGSMRTCGVDLALSRQHVAPLDEALSQVALQSPNVAYWNPHDLLCDGDVCLPFLAGIPTFVDTGHTSEESGAVLALHFAPWMASRFEP